MKLVNQVLALLLAVAMAIPTLPVNAQELQTGTDIKVEQSTEISENDVDDLEKPAGEEGENPELPGEEEAGENPELPGEEEGENLELPGEEEAGENSELPGEGEDGENSELPGEGEAGENSELPGEEENLEIPETVEEEKNIPNRAAEVSFNTGNYEFSIVDLAVSEDAIGDGTFNEDGSFTINIPESNPFFPYEVQFICDGEVTTEWFMTPDDSVEIGGHTFYVSAYMDGTVVTQMSLEIGGETVIGYPARKEFTNDGGGVMPASLLPLEERTIWFDLYNFTPIELSMMQVKAMIESSHQVVDTDNIIWRCLDMYANHDYRINAINDRVDLSYDTYTGGASWEMIVGENDQLADSNVKYVMHLRTRDCSDWLIPTAYTQDVTGIRTNIEIARTEYNDFDYENRRLDIDLVQTDISSDKKVFVSLAVDESLFTGKNYNELKVYEGKHTNVTEAMTATDITRLICAGDMTQVDAGYEVSLNDYNQWITLVTFSTNGTPTGCLPVLLVAKEQNNGVYINSINAVEGMGDVYDYRSDRIVNGCHNVVYTLYKDEEEYVGQYALSFYYLKAGNMSNADVTAAYVGQYSSISEATGKENIKDSLFGIGYSADFNEGVYFTIFIGEDNNSNQEIYKYFIKTEIGPNYREMYSSSDTSVYFYSLQDGEGNSINTLGSNTDEDSYGENNYLVLLVPKGTNLSNIKPSFSLGYNAKMYTSGSSTPEVSGVTSHDFSNGPIQYTVVAEDGEHQKNYWLSIVAGTSSYGDLYINSFDDAESNTRKEGNVVYSTREVMLDSQHDNIHDVWLTNTGLEAIENLSVVLVSDVVELDEYWTLRGNYSLAGMPNGNNSAANMAKVRLHPKEGVDKGTEVSGTLTFKSGDETLVVLNLSGIVGDPAIVTKEIPQAVKYVPYGSVIQNSNKYSWNQVSYTFISGNLPEGMEVKSNGEIYGVPKESGDFTFTVRMDNSYYEFEDDEKTYTLVVQDNTDTNVDNAVDEGYGLSERVQDIDSQQNVSNSQVLVSEGEFVEFVDLYLDGEKLVKDTDYTAESGSTRITIMNQTLAREGVGTHTLGIEFRTTGDVLKRAAQNYDVTSVGSDSGNTGDEGNTGNGDNTGNEGNTDNEGNTGIGGGSDSNNNHESKNDFSYDGGSNDSETTNNFTQLATGLKETAEKNKSNAAVTESVTYLIQPGDTLWKIAVKYFGDGNQWRKILEDNKATITDPNRIYVGQIIIINVGNTTEAADVASTSNDSKIVDGIYTVESGDTMWKISKKIYGTGILWRRLFDANKESIKDASKIYVGQTIKVP